MGLCVGWDVDRHLLGFYSILVSALEHIRYLMASIPDVWNMSTVRYSFGNNTEKCCKKSSVN